MPAANRRHSYYIIFKCSCGTIYQSLITFSIHRSHNHTYSFAGTPSSISLPQMASASISFSPL